MVHLAQMVLLDKQEVLEMQAHKVLMVTKGHQGHKVQEAIWVFKVIRVRKVTLEQEDRKV